MTGTSQRNRESLLCHTARLCSRDDAERFGTRGLWRQVIPYGYRTFSGVIPSNDEIDRYNAIQRKINAFLDAGREAPRETVRASHHVFAMMCEDLTIKSEN